MTAKAQEAYNAWVASGDKSDLQTCVLRLAFKSDQPSEPGMERSHWMDIEVVTDAIETMPGPKPSWEWMQQVAEKVRGEGKSNYRLLTRDRNVGNDRKVAGTVKGQGDTNEVKGHARSKVQHQVDWLVANKDELPAGLVRALGDKLAAVKDADTGKSMLDRRRIANAGANFSTGPRSKAPTSEHDINKIIVGMDRLAITDQAKKQAVVERAVDGDIRFTREGKVDMRSAAVKSGAVRVTKSGEIDGRSSIFRGGATASASSSSSSSSAPGPMKANGTPDMRFAANKAAYGGGGGRKSGGGGGGGGSKGGRRK